MDLLENPFYILKANPRDNRHRIMELADERSLLLDSGDCMDACSNLINPRKRLSAEVAWLPGIEPKPAEEMLLLLKSSPEDLLSLEKLTPIAKTNLLAAGLVHLPDHNFDNVVRWILEISWTFENIGLEELNVMINEERLVSGFPEVSDLSFIEAEIRERRRYYCNVIKSTLGQLSSEELVKAVTFAVEFATEYGKKHSPTLIADLVDLYEVEAQGFLDKEEANIRILVEKLRFALDAGYDDSVLALMVDKLIQVMKNWDIIAQPIQVITKSKGIDHDVSCRVANMVRDLAVYMFNKYNKLDLCKKLTYMLQEVFAEVDKVAELSAEDANTLGEIAEQRARSIEDAKNRAEEWRKEITYEVNVGMIFRNKLSISPEGIKWKGRLWGLDSITRIRWGGTQHFINGIPSKITYNIIFGSHFDCVSIKLKNKVIYCNFIDRLWRSVGVRLLVEYLDGLRNGKKYQFGTVIVSDHGMEFEDEKILNSNRRVFYRWDELAIWNDAVGLGVFCKEKNNLLANFSYQDDDNVHVLEAAIHMLLESNGDKMSNALEE